MAEIQYLQEEEFIIHIRKIDMIKNNSPQIFVYGQMERDLIVGEINIVHAMNAKIISSTCLNLIFKHLKK